MYIVVVVILIISFWYISKTLQTNCVLNNKAYNQPNDDICVTLDRIQWANNYKGRLNMAPRIMFFAIICVLSCCITLLNKMPDSITFIGSVLCVWLFLMAFDGFFSHHGDKFCSFGIDQNVEVLREKLGVKKGDLSTLTQQSQKFAPDDPCPNFVYESAI